MRTPQTCLSQIGVPQEINWLEMRKSGLATAMIVHCVPTTMRCTKQFLGVMCDVYLVTLHAQMHVH